MPKLVLARGEITPPTSLSSSSANRTTNPAPCSSTGRKRRLWRPLQRSRQQRARSPRSLPAPPYGSHSTRPSGCKNRKIGTPGALNPHRGVLALLRSVVAGQPTY